MAHIKTDKSLTYHPPLHRHSYTITPEMGVVKNFPTHVCKALVEKGAEYVGKKKSLKKGKAKPAD